MADNMPEADVPLPGLETVLARNIVAMEKRRRDERAARSRPDKVAAAVSDFAGSLPFVYIHLAAFGAWLVASALKLFDPTLVGLATWASVEAIFVSTFVLITQNRQAADAERRAELDLQTSLLAEHEVSKLIVVVRAIAAKLDLPEAGDAELDDLARDVAPETVLDAIEGQEAGAGATG